MSRHSADPLIASNESNDNDAYSVFAQVDYDFTERTTLGVSLRYDKDEREQTDVGRSGAVRDISFDETQPRAVLSHKFTDDQIGYVSYGTGFRSGGFNGIGGRPFDAETLAELRDRLQVGVAGRTACASTQRSSTRSATTTSSSISTSLRAARRSSTTSRRSSSPAASSSCRRRSRRAGRSTVRSALLDSDIKEIDDTLTVPAEPGNKSPKTQVSSFAFGTQYEFPIGDPDRDAALRLQPMGKQYWHPDNVDIRDPVDMLDLRASLGGERWTATVWGRNVLDEFYCQDFNQSSSARRASTWARSRRRTRTASSCGTSSERAREQATKSSAFQT